MIGVGGWAACCRAERSSGIPDRPGQANRHGSYVHDAGAYPAGIAVMRASVVSEHLLLLRSARLGPGSGRNKYYHPLN